MVNDETWTKADAHGMNAKYMHHFIDRYVNRMNDQLEGIRREIKKYLFFNSCAHARALCLRRY